MLARLGSAIAALLLFAWLAREASGGGTEAFDQWLRDLLYRHGSPLLTSVMRFFTAIGDVVSLLVISAGIVAGLAMSGMKRAAWLFVATMAGAFALNFTLKLAFGRERPEAFYGITLPSSYSFPSGHALLSACCFGFLAAVAAARARSRAARAAIWTAAVLLCLLIGVSRVYLGVHYPTDVIAGYAAAIVWVGSVASADRLLARRRADVQTRITG